METGEIGEGKGPEGVYLNRESLDIIKVTEKSGFGGVAVHLTKTPEFGSMKWAAVWAWA